VTRRLRVYLACTFGLTFSAWGTLVFLQPAVSYGTPKFLLPYAVGGLGPTIAAYVAVLATRADAPLREFHRSVFRWQVPIRWYLVAMGLPIALTLISAGLTMVVHPDDLHPVLAKPWYAFVPYFFEMVAGGGLEEFGWRGIAQPELERRFRLPAAAWIVGSLWAVWHLPLFALPGVPQYGRNFASFAAALLGDAMILAWLRSQTGSVFHCILFHAGGNAAWMLVFDGQFSRMEAAAWSSAAVRIVVGILVVTMSSRRAIGATWSRRTSTASAPDVPPR
jgi:uncharacterized protein